MYLSYVLLIMRGYILRLMLKTKRLHVVPYHPQKPFGSISIETGTSFPSMSYTSKSGASSNDCLPASFLDCQKLTVTFLRGCTRGRRLLILPARFAHTVFHVFCLR